MKKLFAAALAATTLAVTVAQPAQALTADNQKMVNTVRTQACSELRNSYDPAQYKTTGDVMRNAHGVAQAAKTEEQRAFWTAMGEAAAARGVECKFIVEGPATPQPGTDLLHGLSSGSSMLSS